MDGMDKMMMDMEECKRRLETLEGQMRAVADYLKMAFKYNPKSYELVKPEELAKEMGVPMQVR